MEIKKKNKINPKRIIAFSGRCTVCSTLIYLSFACSTWFTAMTLTLLAYPSILQSSWFQQDLSCAEGFAYLKQFAEWVSQNVKSVFTSCGPLKRCQPPPTYLVQRPFAFFTLATTMSYRPSPFCQKKTHAAAAQLIEVCQFRPAWIWVSNIRQEEEEETALT